MTTCLEIHFVLGKSFSDIKILWLIHCRMCMWNYVACKVFIKKSKSPMFFNIVPFIFSAEQKMSSTNNEKYLLPTRKWLTHPCLALRMFIKNLCQNQIWTCRGQFSADSGVRRLYFRVGHCVRSLSRVTHSRRSIKTDWINKIVWEDLARTWLWVMTRRTL